MDQRITVLITKQNELSNIYGARSREFNSATVFTTTEIKFNERLAGILKHIEKQLLESEKNNGDREATIAIRSFEIDRTTEIIVFFFVRNFGHIVPAAAASAQYVALGTPNLIKLKDLQWSIHENEESYRRHFLSSFARSNSKLRAWQNYYAAKTPRYTIIQNHLLPFIKNNDGKRKRPLSKDTKRTKEFQRLKESQTFHVILTDEISSSNAEKHTKMIDAEFERLRNENELLALALRRAADLHDKMLKDIESNIEEKKKLADERKALEEIRAEFVKNQQDLEKQKEHLSNREAAFAEERESWERQINALRSELYQQEKNLHEDYEKRCRVLEADRAELVKNQQDFETQKQHLSNREAAFATEQNAQKANLANREAAFAREQNAQKSNLANREAAFATEQNAQKSNLANREAAFATEQNAQKANLANREAAFAREQNAQKANLTNREAAFAREQNAQKSNLANREAAFATEQNAKRVDLANREAAFARDQNAQRANLANREAAFAREQNAQRADLANREANYEEKMRRLREAEKSLERKMEEFEKSKERNSSGGSASSSSKKSGGSFLGSLFGNYNVYSESDWPYYGVDDPWE